MAHVRVLLFWKTSKVSQLGQGLGEASIADDFGTSTNHSRRLATLKFRPNQGFRALGSMV